MVPGPEFKPPTTYLPPIPDPSATKGRPELEVALRVLCTAVAWEALNLRSKHSTIWKHQDARNTVEELLW